MNYYKNKYQIDDNFFPNSKLWGESTVSIPLFPGMTELEQEYVVDVLLNIIKVEVERIR